MIAFSDRADRFIGSMNLKKLANKLNTNYDNDNLPERVITNYQDDGEWHNHAIAIKNVKKKWQVSCKG